MTAGVLALVAAALFTGAAVYITVAEQPARLALDDRSLLRQWALSYERGLVMQLSLVVAGSALAALAWALTGQAGFAVGGLALVANWPFTARAIMPVNRALQALPADRGDGRVRPLVQRWGMLHAGRGLLGTVATAILASTVARSVGG